MARTDLRAPFGGPVAAILECATRFLIPPALGIILLFGCSRKEQIAAVRDQTTSTPSEGQSSKLDEVGAGSAQPKEVRQTLSVVEKSLKGGSYDEAAANLLQLRMTGTTFSQEDASAYRKALSDLYSGAVEAASKGDPKAKAALQMIRAAGPH